MEVVLWTHAAGGLTAYDFTLAEKLSAVGTTCSPKWARENPERGAAEKLAAAAGAT